ncbi:immunoglobulin kappa light chain-like isoform X2 [Sander vitreus]
MMPLYIFFVLLSEICEVSAVNKTSGVTQDSGIITAKVGENVTLKCFCRDDAVTFLSWYQQSLEGKPLIIASWMKQSTEASIFPAYKERFKVLVQSEEGVNHLIIKNLRVSDSATYYCGIVEFSAVEFRHGAFLHVKTPQPNIQAVVHQPALEPLRLGDSVNLSCTVNAGACAGNQSLYWFRHGVAQSAVMYHSAGQCKQLSNEESNMSCTLNLALKSVSFTDTGMYYCVLASCGDIVFGSGTRVEIERVPLLLVYSLIVALAVSIIVLLVLAFIMYKLKKKSCSVCKEPRCRHSPLCCSGPENNQRSTPPRGQCGERLCILKNKEQERVK